jgi:hypothetical protein
MGRLRVLEAVAAVCLLAGLSGCSVPSGYGVRLNPDGTVDFVNCLVNSALSYDFAVDYMMTGSKAQGDPIEWEASANDPAVVQELYEVMLYGVAPDGYTTVSLLDPPEGWLYVELGGIRAYRGDLVEGEWMWHNTAGSVGRSVQPCDGLDPAEIER